MQEYRKQIFLFWEGGLNWPYVYFVLCLRYDDGTNEDRQKNLIVQIEKFGELNCYKKSKDWIGCTNNEFQGTKTVINPFFCWLSFDTNNSQNTSKWSDSMLKTRTQEGKLLQLDCKSITIIWGPEDQPLKPFPCQLMKVYAILGSIMSRRGTDSPHVTSASLWLTPCASLWLLPSVHDPSEISLFRCLSVSHHAYNKDHQKMLVGKNHWLDHLSAVSVWDRWREEGHKKVEHGWLFEVDAGSCIRMGSHSDTGSHRVLPQHHPSSPQWQNRRLCWLHWRLVYDVCSCFYFFFFLIVNIPDRADIRWLKAMKTLLFDRVKKRKFYIIGNLHPFRLILNLICVYGSCRWVLICPGHAKTIYILTLVHTVHFVEENRATIH